MNALVAEWEQEAALTRKMLERIPTDKLSWKPHAKSKSLGELANHLAQTANIWGPAILEQTNYVWTGEKTPEAQTTEDILARFDKGAVLTKKTLEHAKDMDVMWSFGPIEKPFFTMPRAAAVRMLIFSHLIHHRGQLSVYLRLLDIPVPGMYGPSADERM